MLGVSSSWGNSSNGERWASGQAPGALVEENWLNAGRTTFSRAEGRISCGRGCVSPMCLTMSATQWKKSQPVTGSEGTKWVLG